MNEAQAAQDLFAAVVIIGGFLFLFGCLKAAASLGEQALGTLSIIVCVLLTLFALAGGQLPDPPGGHVVREYVEQQQRNTQDSGGASFPFPFAGQ